MLSKVKVQTNRSEGRPLPKKDGGTNPPLQRAQKRQLGCGTRKLGLLEVGVEPGYGAADAVAAMFGLDEHVAFVFVDYQLGFDIQRF